MKRALIILIMVFLAGCTQERLVDEPVGCSEEAKLCPGGSVAARIPPDCEFEECPVFDKMSIEEAMEIAKDSECMEKGSLSGEYRYNENTYTWWIEFEDGSKDKIGPLNCNPACVVREADRTASINWRCTGAKPPEEKITSFEECVSAGNPVIESYPRQCRADGEVFVEEAESCENLCGDGKCQEVVCMAIGCPCAESIKNCPEDCNSTQI